MHDLRRHIGATQATTLALGAALLFGATTPFASVLARSLSPLWLSAALYLGVGLLLLVTLKTRQPPLLRADAAWFAGSALVGGVAAPVLLVVGLQHTDAATASLLLAFEPVATALIAWLVMREHASRRTVAGMVAIGLGAAVLAWRGSPAASLGGLAVLGAAICWAVDNNLAGRIVSSDAVAVTGLKGLVAGTISAILALSVHDQLPALPAVAAGGALGLAGYGMSLVLFMGALRGLGTARTSAYFATAPFVGAAIALTLRQPTNVARLAFAGCFLAAGVWLHLSELHEHEHEHVASDHEHAHVHDAHHRHDHLPGDPVGAPHAHRHRHAGIAHRHAHAPDVHHRHVHSR